MCKNQIDILPKGFPTHTVDISGKQICLGDRVGYDFSDEDSFFTVIFENNAFRKKYENWDDRMEKPILECGNMAQIMKFKIIDNKNNTL